MITACDLRDIDENTDFDRIYQNADFSGAILSGSFGNITQGICEYCDQGGPCTAFNFADAEFNNTVFDTRSSGDQALDHQNYVYQTLYY